VCFLNEKKKKKKTFSFVLIIHHISVFKIKKKTKKKTLKNKTKIRQKYESNFSCCTQSQFFDQSLFILSYIFSWTIKRFSKLAEGKD
jgi:hypothetical protein